MIDALRSTHKPTVARLPVALHMVICDPEA
jgi:hypothetical protein